MQNRESNVQKGRIISRRLFILASAKLLLFAGITSRLYNLQISDREKYKILSDKVFESGEVCQQVKDKALFFSESLLNHFLETWSLEVPGPIEACDNLEKISKDYSLHFTTSHKRKFRSLWSILLKKYSHEKEVLKKLDMDCFKEIKLSPKEKTSFLCQSL